MKKLLRLKKWVTVPETAQHLTIVFGEEVTEADVLRLALDGQLRLSVYFVNHAHARCGSVVSIEEVKYGEFPPHMADMLPGIPEEAKGKPLRYIKSLAIDEERFLNLSENVNTIEGVWDLPMIGNERLDIEHKYQNLIGGPSVTLQGLDGAFVEREGLWGQLQEDFDDNKHQPGSNAELDELKQHITNNNIDQLIAEKLFDEHSQHRREFLERRESRPNSERYFPAGGLPEDGVLVVRTDALRQFEEAINAVTQDTEKSMTTNERNTLLTIVSALCDYSAIKIQERGAAVQIAKMTEEIGAPVSDDTIRKILGKIAEAVERRKK